MTPLVSSTLLRTQSDGRLVGLASNGSERAFEAIVERYRKPLYRWCRRVLPDARAEDAVQTTFLKAWTALESGVDVDELKPWLYRIARNAALDNARKAGYDYSELTEALRVSDGPEAEVERRRVIRDTLTGVAGLPDNQREALLKTAAGHRRADIARELHVSEGAVRQLVHRARSSLRAAATALTPMPLVSWACAMGAEGGASSQRIAELAAGAGSAGLASAAIKTGTVIVAAGVLAAGPGSDLRKEVAKDSSASAASTRPGDRGVAPSTDNAADDRIAGFRRDEAGDDHGRGRGSSGKRRSGGDDNSGHGSSGSKHSESGGSGRSGSDDSGGDDHSGSGTSGSGRSGSDDSGGDDHSGSGTSGSGSGDSGSSGSGTSGSGSSGSGGDDHSDSGSSGSGTSGSGTSGSGSGESGSSGSGGDDHSRTESSGSGSSGSGSGEPDD